MWFSKFYKIKAIKCPFRNFAIYESVKYLSPRAVLSSQKGGDTIVDKSGHRFTYLKESKNKKTNVCTGRKSTFLVKNGYTFG